MLERSASVFGKDVWSELLRAADGALATLDANELEELARRTEALVARVTDVSLTGCEARESLAQLRIAVPDHRRLGNLLLATNDNLQVLRRLYCQRVGEGVESPWER